MHEHPKTLLIARTRPSFGACVLLSSTLALATVALTTAQPRVSDALPRVRLIRPSSLAYQGAFKLPTGNGGNTRTGRGFDYGARAITFNPNRNSLFVVGHDWDQYIAEIEIPAIGGTAALLQPLTEASDAKPVGTGTTKVGGTLVYGGHLYFTKYVYYDGNGSQTESLFVRPLDLAVEGQVRGPYRTGPLGAGFYSGYIAAVPAPLQSALGGPVLIGNCCLSIITRTSYGPAVFAIDPPAALERPQAIPLVYYPASRPALGRWNSVTEYFGGADSVTGLVVPEGFHSVLFFGRHGTTFCYGGPECKDPTTPSQGVHGYPYLSYVWAYAVDDLAAVRTGSKSPWDVKPYAVWALDELKGAAIGGAAYDPASGRIFLAQPDSVQSIVHVYRLVEPK